MEFFTSRIYFFVSTLLRFIICLLIIIVFTSAFEHNYNIHFNCQSVPSYVLSWGDSHWFPLLLSVDDFFSLSFICSILDIALHSEKCIVMLFWKVFIFCFNRWLILLKFQNVIHVQKQIYSNSYLQCMTAEISV